MGGQVIRIGRGRGHLNILDPGEAVAAADRLTGKARAEVLADALGRRHTMVSTLITIARAAAPIDREEIILDRALRILDERSTGIPVLPDLIQVINDGPEDLRLAAMDRGERVRYDDIVEALQVTLNGLLAHGRLGEIFSGETDRADAPRRPGRVRRLLDRRLRPRAAGRGADGLLVLRLRRRQRRPRARRRRQGAAPALLRDPRRAVARAARRPGHGRPRRRAHPPEPHQGHRRRDVLAHHERPYGPPPPRGPHEGARLRRARRHGHLRRAARRRDGRCSPRRSRSRTPSRSC